MQSRRTYILQAIAVGGGLASLFTGLYAIVGGATSAEGTVAILLLLALSLSLGVALGIQALSYGRAARYARALGQILRLTDRVAALRPETLTGAQATEVCDRVVDDLATIFSQICGGPCFVSLEIMTPSHQSPSTALRRASDYVVVNLSRDAAGGDVTSQRQHRHSIDGNSSYRKIFHDPECGAHYYSDDVAAEESYNTTETRPGELELAGRGRFGPGADWPLHYRSTLVVKVCKDDECRAGREHAPAAFLWLRSPMPGAFHEVFDVELARHMSKAVAPMVMRCVRANKPTHDFRRQSEVAVPALAHSTSA